MRSDRGWWMENGRKWKANKGRRVEADQDSE
jgi:hypothetical protein